MEKIKQMTLEKELEAVQRQLAAARAGLGSARSAATARALSYENLYTGLQSASPHRYAPPRGSAGGIEDYYISRLGKGVKICNLLASPGKTIDEAFGEALCGGGGGTEALWLVTDDHWTEDLHKSHFHNLLETATTPGKQLNVNVLVLTSSGSGPTDGKKDVALYAMTYGHTYVAAVSHKLDNTQLMATLKASAEFPGPSIITAPNTGDKLTAMMNGKRRVLHLKTVLPQ